MTPPTGPASDGAPTRRRVMRLLAGAPLLTTRAQGLGVPGLRTGAVAGVAEGFRDGATLLVAGPDGGRLDVLSRVIVPPLSRSLPPGTMLSRTLSGGTDGVTGANQFDTRTEPDGRTVLMVPGAAALAWLSGDPRAQFDAAHWVPVMAATTPCVVVGRSAGPRFAKGARLRIPAASATGPEMPAMLAIDLTGALSVPVFGLADEASAREALLQGTVDVLFLRGPQVLEQLAMLSAMRIQPLFSFGATSEGGEPARDPLLPEVPYLAEFATGIRGTAPRTALYTAWQGAAAASRLEFALVLQQLTPAALVALWRRAGLQTAGAPGVNDLSAGLRTVAAPAANACISAVAPNAPALLELRRWLAVRFNVRP